MISFWSSSIFGKGTTFAQKFRRLRRADNCNAIINSGGEKVNFSIFPKNLQLYWDEKYIKRHRQTL